MLRPMPEAHKKLWAIAVSRGRGRPVSDTPKAQVTLRIDQDALEHFKASGPGWQSRINAALRKAAKLG